MKLSNEQIDALHNFTEKILEFSNFYKLQTEIFIENDQQIVFRITLIEQEEETEDQNLI